MFFTNLLEANMRAKNFQFDITYYPKTTSTNEDIWEIYNITKKNNLFVITDNQTKGKGRHHNSWISTPNKSITCSFLMKQVFDKVNFHSLIIPLSIVKGIKKFLNIDLQIKWPNDIIYKNKKLAGILIESKKCKSEYLFNIGIGMNINEEIEDFPSELKNKTTSLKIINKNLIQREPLLATILNELDQLIDSTDYNYILNEWMKHCSHLDENIKFKDEDKFTNGIFKKINKNGQAVIENNFEPIAYDGAIQIL